MSKLTNLVDQIDENFANDEFSLTLISKLGRCAKVMASQLVAIRDGQWNDHAIKMIKEHCAMTMYDVEKILSE